MARLSINDLNTLSGINDDGLNILYNSFRRAHTKVFNKANTWINTYISDKSIYNISDLRDSNTADILYDKMRKSYYEGSVLLDEIDLFDVYVSDYISLLTIIKRSDLVSDVMKLNSIMQTLKKKIIEYLPECYELYSYIYNLDE